MPSVMGAGFSGYCSCLFHMRSDNNELKVTIKAKQNLLLRKHLNTVWNFPNSYNFMMNEVWKKSHSRFDRLLLDYSFIVHENAI